MPTPQALSPFMQKLANIAGHVVGTGETLTEDYLNNAGYIAMDGALKRVDELPKAALKKVGEFATTNPEIAVGAGAATLAIPLAVDTGEVLAMKGRELARQHVANNLNLAPDQVARRIELMEKAGRNIGRFGVPTLAAIAGGTAYHFLKT